MKLEFKIDIVNEFNKYMEDIFGVSYDRNNVDHIVKLAFFEAGVNAATDSIIKRLETAFKKKST